MGLSTRYALVIVLLACTRAEPPTNSVTISPPNPLCHRFGGKVHGTSSCVTLDRAANIATPSERRIRPGVGSHAACDDRKLFDELTVGATRIRIDCDYSRGDAGYSVIVRARVVEDTQRPALKGFTFELGSGGFTDFISVHAKPRGDDIDFSVDFGILD